MDAKRFSMESWFRTPTVTCRANMVHTRQSRPDSGIDVQMNVHKIFQEVPSLLGSSTVGRRNNFKGSEDYDLKVKARI